jgi:DNA-binding protein H-NS
MDLSNLSSLSSAELRTLQEQLKQELKQRESHDLAKAREEILAIAKSVGLPLQELLASGAPRAKTGSVAPRYRNPADTSQLWTGRGRQPKWVKDWLEAGKDIAGLKV